jgi:hypothetical protein
MGQVIYDTIIFRLVANLFPIWLNISLLEMIKIECIDLQNKHIDCGEVVRLQNTVEKL